MWWLVVFLGLFALVTYWSNGDKEGLEGQAPQSSAEVIAQLETNKAAIEDLNLKIKELQQSDKRIDEIENKINGTTEMLKTINAQCSKTD